MYEPTQAFSLLLNICQMTSFSFANGDHQWYIVYIKPVVILVVLSCFDFCNVEELNSCV